MITIEDLAAKRVRLFSVFPGQFELEQKSLPDGTVRYSAPDKSSSVATTWPSISWGVIVKLWRRLTVVRPVSLLEPGLRKIRLKLMQFYG